MITTTTSIIIRIVNCSRTTNILGGRRSFCSSSLHSVTTPFYPQRMSSSSPTTISMARLVAVSIAAAESASQVIRGVMTKGNLGIIDKGVNDLQTEADRSAQRLIIGMIRAAFAPSSPGNNGVVIRIVGEEDETTSTTQTDPPSLISESESRSIESLEKVILNKVKVEENSPLHPLLNVPLPDVTVWVDPLDGTSEYTQGLVTHVTTLIGISVRGKAVAGVVAQPYWSRKGEGDGTARKGSSEEEGRTIWGIVGIGLGVVVDGKPVEESDRGALLLPNQNQASPSSLTITTTRSHSNRDIIETIDSINPSSVLRVGGAGHKVLLVLEGKADAYVFPSPGCKRWDTCGPEAVLKAAGGHLTDILGRDIVYDTFEGGKEVDYINKSGVLASLKEEVHQKCLSLIPVGIKEKFAGGGQVTSHKM